MLRKTFFIIISIFAVSSLKANENAYDLFSNANKLYEQGKFSQAIEIYESLINENSINASLYYNLGNAYYRSQQIGLAIVNYERALRLSPRDADIKHNLEFLRNLVKEPQQDFIESVITWLNNLLNLNELTILTSLLYFMLVISICIYIIKKQNLIIYISSFLLIFVILFSSWLLLKINNEQSTKWAIVIAGPSEVRNGPGINNSVGFSLPEGRKVVILGHKDNWAAIGLKSEGLKGWIEKNYIEKI